MDQIKNYIAKRYDRWVDYSTYHCMRAGMEGEAIDVLNEVLVMLLEKCESNESQIMSLYERRKGQYRELDFFILQMIKLNITSDTSPYRHKYKPIPRDENVDFRQRGDLYGNDDYGEDCFSHSSPIFEKADEIEEERDYHAEQAEEMELVRWIFDRLALDQWEYCAFKWKFFEDESLAQLSGEDRRKAYNGYSITQLVIWQILKSEGLRTAERPQIAAHVTQKRAAKRIDTIIIIFKLCHAKDLRLRIQGLKYILREKSIINL